MPPDSPVGMEIHRDAIPSIGHRWRWGMRRWKITLPRRRSWLRASLPGRQNQPAAFRAALRHRAHRCIQPLHGIRCAVARREHAQDVQAMHPHPVGCHAFQRIGIQRPEQVGGDIGMAPVQLRSGQPECRRLTLRAGWIKLRGQVFPGRSQQARGSRGIATFVQRLAPVDAGDLGTSARWPIT